MGKRNIYHYSLWKLQHHTGIIRKVQCEIHIYTLVEISDKSYRAMKQNYRLETIFRTPTTRSKKSPYMSWHGITEVLNVTLRISRFCLIPKFSRTMYRKSGTSKSLTDVIPYMLNSWHIHGKKSMEETEYIVHERIEYSEKCVREHCTTQVQIKVCIEE